MLPGTLSCPPFFSKKNLFFYFDIFVEIAIHARTNDRRDGGKIERQRKRRN